MITRRGNAVLVTARSLGIARVRPFRRRRPLALSDTVIDAAIGMAARQGLIAVPPHLATAASEIRDLKLQPKPPAHA